jgi:ferredoxin-NADP reductase
MNDVFEKARKMKVARVWEEADKIKCLDLKDATGEQLPSPPGAHIDLHLHDGAVCRYSICNGRTKRGQSRSRSRGSRGPGRVAGGASTEDRR